MAERDEQIALLRRESRSLVQRLRLWTPTRWAAAALPFGTRADLVHHLAQALADTAADLERQPRRVLPRLDSDLGLPDQLAVTSDDLVRTDPPAGTARTATCHLLAHRLDLLDEDVPAGLAAVLGLDHPEIVGRKECEDSGQTTLGRA